MWCCLIQGNGGWAGNISFFDVFLLSVTSAFADFMLLKRVKSFHNVSKTFS